ncbi:Ig-like domain-containing protein [Anaerococcus rubeinfantis]|uniref:Ig-like domain-containing protein n=1 Tax=Anaerococcus rubeinfantis TaxID=1720199 RepID=UPI00073E9033|nr:Ig-like domain-containing protein [Anaerococcus rubeinfantis]
MDKNNIAKRIIEQKKLNGSKRKPKYATRKLSIGLVSCMLGYALLVSPSSAEAAELDNNQTEVVEEVETKEEATNEENVVEEKETPVEETLSDEQAIEEKASEETAPQETNKEVKEEVTSKEASEEDKEENAPKLEMNEEVKPEAVAAPADENREPKDISNDVQSKYVALTEEGHETKGTINPDNGEAVGWEVSFTSPRGTIAGDYFTIDLSDNLSLKGIEPDHENEYPIENDGKVVADGVRVDRSTIKYTFNENINDERNVVVSVKGFAYIDKTKVPNNSPEEKISIKVGDTVDEHNINVQYGKPYYTGENLNGMSQFTEFNPETGEYTQVFYINPDSKIIGTSTSDDWSANKVAVFIDGVDPETGSQSDVKYTEDNTKITIHKLKSGEKLPDAIIENPAVNYDDPIYRYKFRDNGIELVFADHNDDKLPSDFIEDPYVVIVKSTAAPSQTGNNIISKGILYGGARQHTMYNDIVTTVGDTEAQGDKIGYFKEHHVYYTKVDGVLQEDKTFTLHSNKTEGYDYDNYFTSKNEIDDFKFVKVDADNLVENPVYNEDGTIARGKYEPGKTKEVTYIYERDIKHGSFQEHHIYQTLDENGNVIAEETVTKDVTETTGIDEDEYSTSKKDKDGNVVTDEKDKDGYKLVEVKATNEDSAKLGVKFDNQGAATSGNYVNGEKLEVTYIYQKQKPVAKKGSFKETHVYITKDFEGNVLEDKTITEAGKSSEGTKDEKYESSKVDKDGYEFTKVTADKGSDEVTISKDGKSVEAGNYVEEKELAVTYEYVKQPGRFVEHHIYQTVDKNGKVISTDDTVDVTEKDGKKIEGFSNENVSTDKKDKEGYTFKEATEIKLQNDDSEKTYTNYVPGKVLEKTYIYTKTQEEPVAKKGSFKETHVYKTLDFDGNVLEDKTITETGKSSKGTKDESYESSKVDKAGYEFTKVTADEGSENDVTISEDGKQVEAGNYVEDKELAVTYEYVKQPGRFVEHHIYQTVDKNGKVISTDETVDVTKKDGKPIEGYSNEKIKTSQQPKEGYEYDSETELTSENYVPGKVLEKTYIYTKTKEEPVAKKGSFKETHVYKTLDFDGNVIEDKIITEAGKSSKGTKDESYESSKVDKAGYEFTKVTADEGSENDVTISEDGKQVEAGNYVEDKELAVTYEYVKQPGRFVEHHIYQTVDKNGKVISTDDTVDVTEKDGKPIEGYSNETISTAPKQKDGYTYQEKETKTTLDSEEVSSDLANYVPGKTIGKTYIYTKTKEEPVVQTGTFTEEHIYKTLDFEGKVVETSDPEQGEHKEGNKDVQYTTKAKEKEGFKLVSVEANDTDAVIDSENGTAETGNIVEGKDLKVTYTYEKQPGRFVEHHIYQTVDKDGKVVSTDDTVDVTEKDGKKIEGFSNENVSTDKKDKDGYTFKEATEIKLQNDDSEKTYTNYVPGKVLEKTYIYTKTQTEWTPLEETGKFQEHHIYITKDKDGKEVSREVVDGKVTGGNKDMTYTTGKVDKDKFKLVRIENLVGNPTYDKDGNETSGNYKPGVKQEITYVYEKTVTPWTELEKPRKQEKPSDSKKTGEKVNNEKTKVDENNDDLYKVKYVEPSSDNVQTGVGSVSGIVATLSASLGGLFVSKKRKNK